MAVREASALDLADAVRRGDSDATSYELWRAADREAKGIETARRSIYRHAMIHAGFLVTAKGPPYRRCPDCREQLD